MKKYYISLLSLMLLSGGSKLWAHDSDPQASLPTQQVSANDKTTTTETTSETPTVNNQEQDPQDTESYENYRKPKLVPFPVIAANPTVGWAFGFAPAVNWYMGPKETTRMSSVLLTAIYSTKNQLFTNARGTVFFNEDSWVLMGDIRFQIASQPTYGLGTLRHPQNVIVGGELPSEIDREYLRENQMLKYSFLRTHLTMLKRHQDTPFYYGLGYRLDYLYNIRDQSLNLNPEPGENMRITQHYRYNKLKGFDQESYIESGMTFNLNYDSRDNIINPYYGRYAFLQYSLLPTWLGSSKNSSILFAEYRDYFNVSKDRPRNILAWWSYAWFVTSGSVPYMFLPATGWDMFSRSGRGYTIGRFRGEDLIYSELEYRFALQQNKDFLGGVVFVNAATASSRTEDINLFKHVNVAVGAGLRFMISKSGRNNICVDYAHGLNGSNGLFIQLNETF